jgi:hypothetical protein
MALNKRPTGTDDDLVAIFKHIAIPNEGKSKAAGRLICDDVEICEIRTPGRTDIKHFPATEFSHWKDDQFTGAQLKVTYAERFPRQYLQFKQQAAQTKSGTLLERVPFLSEGRRAELRALNVYTVEQLAHIDGQELKNLGPGGRDWKNQAIDFIEEAKALVPNIAMQTELEALRARTQALEADNEVLKAKRDDGDGSQFDEMSNLQIKDFIFKETGTRPIGNPSRKTLLQLANTIASKQPTPDLMPA